MRHRLLALALSVVALSPVVLTAQGAQRQESQAPADSRVRGFLISLVVGDTKGSSLGTLKPAEVRALADLKDFLPYKGYQVVDSTPMIGTNGPNIWLSGPNLVDGEFDFAVRSTQVSPTVVNVEMLQLWKVTFAEGKPKRTLMFDTSFKIAAGETVVVGTSRLGHTRGLLLLLTAVAK
jgi:hypothetical protein